MLITRHDDVRAALTAPALDVPPVPAGAGVGTVEWLRSRVVRFSSGETRRGRRAVVNHILAALEPDLLRSDAAHLTRTILADSGGRSVDLMAAVARVVPVRVLAAALEFHPDVVEDVALVAHAYHPHVTPDPIADQAVARLVAASGAVADEPTANRIGLLIQAYDATAGLVGNAALILLPTSPEAPVGAVITETLRSDPPVRSTRRVATVPTRIGDTDIPAGTVVEVSLATPSPGEHLAFGAGAHECPGQAIAIALAEGILDSIRQCRLTTSDVTYLPSPNLRVPAAVEVTVR